LGTVSEELRSGEVRWEGECVEVSLGWDVGGLGREAQPT